MKRITVKNILDIFYQVKNSIYRLIGINDVTALDANSLITGFEYVIIMCEAARKNKIKIDHDLVIKAEEMLKQQKDWQEANINMLPNILSILSPQ